MEDLATNYIQRYLVIRIQWLGSQPAYLFQLEKGFVGTVIIFEMRTVPSKKGKLNFKRTFA